MMNMFCKVFNMHELGLFTTNSIIVNLLGKPGYHISMVMNQNWLTAYFGFYFPKLQICTLCNCMYNFKMFKTCDSVIILTTLS